MLLLFILAALGYGGATFAYGNQAQDEPVTEGGRMNRYGRWLLAVGATLHFLAIGAQCVDGDHPLKNIFLATSFGALLAVGGYLGLSRGRQLEGLGPLMAPVGLVGLVLGVVFSNVSSGTALPGGSGVASAHVAFASAGLAGFTLATGTALLYLAMERRLRRKEFRPTEGGMSLHGLDRLHHRLVLVVTPVFTLAIVTGVLWIIDAGGLPVLTGRVFEIGAAGVAWAASVVSLVARALWGTRGRRSAWLTLTAFAAIVLIVVWYGVKA